MFTRLKLKRKGLLDSRNIHLWNDVSKAYKIKIFKADNQEYSVNYSNGLVTFRYDPSDINADSFAHELLHIHLRMQGCLVGEDLKSLIIPNQELSRILSFKLIEHIANCLDHVKMLPIYLELNYKRERFIQDYFIPKCNTQEADGIAEYYRHDGKIRPKLVDVYVGTLFSIFANPNDEIDHSNELKILSMIDPIMFQISKRMFEAWKEVPMNDYDLILSDYLNELKLWLSLNLT
ncbi:hypothetical protein D3C87_40090 [compost metagenome]